MSATAESRFIFVETRVGIYRSQYESEKADCNGTESRKAILCFALSDLITQGIGLYASINNLDSDSRGLVYASEIQYDACFESRIGKLYGNWLAVSEEVAKCYEVLESEFTSRGLDTDPIQVLRKGIREVREMLKPDIGGFNHPKFVDLRDAAIDEFRRGDVHPV